MCARELRRSEGVRADRDIRDGAAAVLVLQPELDGRGLAERLVAALPRFAGREREPTRLRPQLYAGRIGSADAGALRSRQQRSAAAAAQALREACLPDCVPAMSALTREPCTERPPMPASCTAQPLITP